MSNSALLGMVGNTRKIIDEQLSLNKSAPTPTVNQRFVSCEYCHSVVDAAVMLSCDKCGASLSLEAVQAGRNQQFLQIDVSKMSDYELTKYAEQLKSAIKSEVTVYRPLDSVKTAKPRTRFVEG